MKKEYPKQLSGEGELSHAHIGANIRRLRNLYDIKQEDFAKELGISRQMLHHYENNNYPIPEPVIKMITEYFNINFEAIMLPNIAVMIKKT